MNYRQIVQLIEDMKKDYDDRFVKIFYALDKLMHPVPKSRIGFRRKDEEDS